MTRARGVPQTPRDTRHAARDFLDRMETKNTNIYECNIKFKIKKYTLKHQKTLCQSEWIAIQSKGEMIQILSLIFFKKYRNKRNEDSRRNFKIICIRFIRDLQ